jgi:seryl-tRNA synthetase
MLDRRALTDKTEEIRERLKSRGDPTAMGFDKIVELANERRRLIKQRDDTTQQQKAATSGFQAGMKQKLPQPELDKLREQAKQLGQEVKDLDARVSELEKQLDDLALRVPNLPHESVPVGPDETANVVVRSWGEPKRFDFAPKAHFEIGEALGILDFEGGARTTGARFTALRREGARLNRALAQFMLDLHTSRGYEEVLPPFIVNRDSMVGTGQLPKFEADAFRLAEPPDWFLIPTSEVPLVNLHKDEVIPLERLPIKYCAYSPCFRAEAGSAGKDTRGMIRQHQFEKVELVQITAPEKSYEAHEQLTADAEEVLKRLNLPYRVVLLSTGDMGATAAKTYDLEVWLPAQNAYREISSCSNCEAYQARRARIRYQVEKGKNFPAHTLNGSGVAIGRALVAVLENYQQPDGSVVVPEALRPYMGGLAKIEKRT